VCGVGAGCVRGNTREVKCQRRALTSGLRQAKEAIVRTAEAHKWTKAALERMLDDVRERALPRREEADHFLREEEQEQRSKWMNDCQVVSYQPGVPGHQSAHY
jgi:hypothetical protein